MLTMSQVGINTTNPTATFHVNGNVKIENIPDGFVSDSILVIHNKEVRKIALSSLNINVGVCPKLDKTSSSYHLLFHSEYSIPKPNNSLQIQGLNFTGAGTWISNNTYFYSYSNTTGTPLNLTSFSVDFNGLKCNYKK